MNIIFHIGISKTGSTLIQFFCMKNREKLIKDGILFPCTAFSQGPDGRKTRSSGHYFFIPALKNNNIGIFKKLEKELSENDNIDNLLISSENFSLNPDIIHSLKKYFSTLGKCKVLIYLRRQDYFIESIYGEFISGGWRKLSVDTDVFLDSFIRENTDIVCDYHKIIEPWEKAFGIENIKIRPFEQGQWKNGDLIQDFFLSINLPWKNNYEHPSEEFKNSSAPTQINKTIRYINRIPLNGNLYRSLLSTLFETELHNFQSTSKQFFFSPQQRIKILKRYRSSNSLIAKRYLDRNNGMLFLEKEPKKNEEWQPVKITNPDLVALVFSSFLEKKSIEIEEVLTEYKNNFNSVDNTLKITKKKLSELENINTTKLHTIEGNLKTLSELKSLSNNTLQIIDNHEVRLNELKSLSNNTLQTIDNHEVRLGELKSLNINAFQTIDNHDKNLKDLNSFNNTLIHTMDEHFNTLTQQKLFNSNASKTIQDHISKLFELNQFKKNISATIKDHDKFFKENNVTINKTEIELQKVSNILKQNILANYINSRNNLIKRIFRFFKYCGRSENTILCKAGLVDVRYYFSRYPDTIKGGISAVKHYVRYGACEGRNPSESFDTVEYIIKHTDVIYRGYNPLVHYYLQL